jgi:DNA-binding transcriptional ArsR family regulator
VIRESGCALETSLINRKVPNFQFNMEITLSADQLRCLASPSCQQVFVALRSMEQASAGEIAKQIARSPATVGYHLRALLATELIREAGKRVTARKPESIYEPSADRMRLPPPGSDPAVSEQTRRAVLAGMRHAMHGYKRAAEKGLGQTGFIHIIRGSMRLSEKDANRFLELVEEANRFAIGRQAQDGVLLQWSSVVYPEDIPSSRKSTKRESEDV